MYTDFFGLKEKPFNLTPSSRFLYLGESHKEALALLTYGVNERKGFILLTGEVGTGKTTMVQALLGNLNDSVEYVYLSNPLLSADDLMNYLAFSALKKKVHFKSKSEFLLEFEAFLKQCLQHQKNFVLIIDEAQKLSFELLEEIRLLSNMETADEKLINIFLVGQPELNEHLSEARCRPLLQRISVRHHISTLSLQEASEYVMTRLSIAGAREGQKIFPKKTVKALHEFSSGYPRMINVLADNALLIGYARGNRRITPEVIKDCYDDMKLEGSFLGSKKKEEKESEIEKVKVPKRRRPWKWAALFILILLGAGFGFSPKGLDMIDEYRAFLPFDFFSDPVTEKHQPFQETKNIGITAEEKPSAVVEKVKEQKNDSRIIQEESPEEVENLAAPEAPKVPQEDTTWQTVTVESGDTLLGLVAKVYGLANEKVLSLVQRHNPDLKDPDRIEIGQKIIFPFIDRPSEKSPVFTVHIASFKPFDKARSLFEELMNEGYEVYMMPVYTPQKGKIFRVTLGSFKSRRESNAYASAILRRGVSKYAHSIQLEMS